MEVLNVGTATLTIRRVEVMEGSGWTVDSYPTTLDASLSGDILLSGGSDKRNEVRYGRFYPVIEKLKKEFPFLRIAIQPTMVCVCHRTLPRSGVSRSGRTRGVVCGQC